MKMITRINNCRMSRSWSEQERFSVIYGDFFSSENSKGAFESWSWNSGIIKSSKKQIAVINVAKIFVKI